MNVLSPVALAIYDSINAALSPDQLDNFARSVSHHLSKGSLTDDEATFLSNAVEKRRPQHQVSLATGVVVGKLAARMFSRFAPRPCRRRLTDANARSGGTGSGRSGDPPSCPTICGTTIRRASGPYCA